MQGKSRLGFWALLLLMVGMPCCGGYINYPAPKLVSLTPPSIEAGSPQFFLFANGKDFSPGSTVEWNGTTLVTIFLSQTQLQATVPAVLVQNPGQSTVVVFTTQPGGGTSSSVTFTITPNATPIPHIDSLTPPTVPAGAAAEIQVSGQNFVSTSEAIVNGTTCIGSATCSTAVSSSTSIFVTIPASMLQLGGTLDMTILNPPAPPPAPPNGGASNTVPLAVLNPLPSITTLAPTSVEAGAAATTLTVTGTSLVSSSVVEVNGAPRPTTLVSATSVSTQLTQADLALGGVNQIQVLNPTPGGGTSNILTFAVNPTSSVGMPLLVDYASDGSPANLGVCGTTCSAGALTQANAGPSASTTGQFIAFASISTNLIAGGTNGVSNIFVRDTCLGMASCNPLTTLVTTDPNGNAAGGSSFEPAIDSDGADIAFTSLATNLVTTVPLPAGLRQVFWRPTCTSAAACTSTTNAMQLVSISADGLSAGNGDSFNPAISPDGRYVAFVSLATNLVSNVAFDGVTPEVFVRDTCNGAASSTTCNPTTFLVSTSDGVTPANGASASPSVGTTASNISFTSSATNLGTNAPNPAAQQEIFVRTCSFNASICVGVTSLISTPDGVTPANGTSSASSIVAEGRFIAFASTATNLGVNSGGVQQIYVRDTCALTTPCAPSLALISSPDGTTPGNALSERPSINMTGQMIAFASLATNLGLHTANGIENIFVRDTCATITTACSPATILASLPPGSSPPAANGTSLAPSVSSDGHTVSFLSFANNLVSRDTNGFSDIFLASTTF